MFNRWLRDIRMGYTSGQAGIMRRMLREEGGWQSHLVKTGEYIQQAVKEQQPRSIRILGSGWLLDVPIKYLMDRCERIVLTDMVHPNQIVNKYSGFKNIVFETLDITGGVAAICYRQRKNNFEGNEFVQRILNLEPVTFSEDLVISVNLLSQLSIILTDYLSKKIPLTDTQIAAITEEIQKMHLKGLPAGRAALISDYEEEYLDEDDKFIGSKPTVYADFPVNGTRKEWIWRFDTKMMYKSDCKTMLRVAAVRL